MRDDSLNAWFDDAFLKWGDRKAITFMRNGQVETDLTYSQLDREVAQFAGLLAENLVSRGDRVILFLEKSLLSVVAHLALQKLGAVSVPLNPGFKESEMRYLLHDAAPGLVLSDPEKGGMIRHIDPTLKILELQSRQPYRSPACSATDSEKQLPAPAAPDDPALIIYTSGTTGDPKGAVLTHRNLLHDARNIIHIWEITEADRLCHSLPLFHVHGLCFALHTALLSGASIIMPDRFEPQTVLDALANKEEDAACTVFMAVPAMYTKLMDHLGENKIDFSHIRLLTSGSAPLLVQEFDRIRRIFGKAPVEREGMSETGMNFSNPLHGDKKPGSIGVPLPGLEVRIVDPETFADVTPGDVGEIWLKGPGITPGYWQKPEETRATFEDGWFRTGDLGRRDEEGYYYLTDRIKHIIISGGENVSAKEVETVINRIDGVVESSVVGLPDDKWGERVAAAVYIQPDAGLTDSDIKVHCKEHLHDWKCPKTIRFVDEIPKNTMGKVLKEEVKKIFDG